MTKRRPRNKIAALPAERRQMVTEMLLDGETYDAVRDALKAERVSVDEMPGNKAFKAFMGGDEYLSIQNEYRTWRQKASQKRILGKALQAGGGLSAAIDSGIYEAYELLLENFSNCEDVSDISNIVRSMATLKKVAIADDLHKLKLEQAKALDRAKARIADASKTKTLTPEETCAVVADEMDRVLGLK